MGGCVCVGEWVGLWGVSGGVSLWVGEYVWGWG